MLDTDSFSNLLCLEARKCPKMKGLDLPRSISSIQLSLCCLYHRLCILLSFSEGYDRSNVRNRKLLLCLLMTSCDLADQTRPWENAKGVAVSTSLIKHEKFLTLILVVQEKSKVPIRT